MHKPLDQADELHVRQGAATIDKGRRRAKQILAVARETLAFDGYPHFKLRSIAARAGISLGNLQYYFPTKNDLLRALIADTNEYYDRQYPRLFSKVPNVPEKRLLATVEFLLDDLQKPLVRGFFFQLWAMSCHDEFAEECMRSTYAHYRNMLADRIKAIKPDLATAELQNRAALIQSMIEGSTLSIIRDGNKLKKRRGLSKMIREESLRIASQ